MIKSIDHIAIKVANLKDVCQAFENLGITCNSIEEYDEVGLQIAFLDTGENKIELLEVIDQNSPIVHDKTGLHHLALKTDNIEDTYNKMKQNDKFKVEGVIRKGAHDKKIFFFKIKTQKDVLFECVE
ncbi:VOC domain-containing protein [Candidatus Magnetomoraceae bacterium gMMP-15]